MEKTYETLQPTIVEQYNLDEDSLGEVTLTDKILYGGTVALILIIVSLSLSIFIVALDRIMITRAM